MSISARLVVLVLLFSFPQVSFGIPPFSLGGVPPPAQAAATAAPVTGDQVARQIDRRDTGRDLRSSMQMRLFDRQNRKRERTLTLIALDGNAPAARSAAVPASTAPGSPAEKAAKGKPAAIGDRLLIRFTYPNDIAGTSFLVWERDGAEDERFLYLPALGRVRRIAGAERQESFVGSDFTYEDIGGRALDDYTYTLIDANGTHQAADGRQHPAYILESRAKDPDALYPRVLSHVRKDNFVVVQAEIFNRRNEREKEYRVLRLEQIEGIWTTMEVLMTNQLDRTRTEMTTTSVDYNVGLGEQDFSRRELERGAR